MVSMTAGEKRELTWVSDEEEDVDVVAVVTGGLRARTERFGRSALMCKCRGGSALSGGRGVALGEELDAGADAPSIMASTASSSRLNFPAERCCFSWTGSERSQWMFSRARVSRVRSLTSLSIASSTSSGLNRDAFAPAACPLNASLAVSSTSAETGLKLIDRASAGFPVAPNSAASL